MIALCVNEYNVWLTDIILSPAEEKWVEEEGLKKGFERFIQTALVRYNMALRMKNVMAGTECEYFFALLEGSQ